MKSFSIYLPFNMVWAGIIPSRWFKAVTFIFFLVLPALRQQGKKNYDSWHVNSPNSAFITAFSFFSDSVDSASCLKRERGNLVNITKWTRDWKWFHANWKKILTLYPTVEQKFVLLALCRNRSLLINQSFNQSIR